MFRFKDAKLVLPFRLSNLFIGIYPRKVVFGSSSNEQFLHCIVVDLENIKLFYKTLVQILELIQEENIQATSYEKLFHFKNFIFAWRISDEGNIIFGIVTEDHAVNPPTDKLIANFLFTYNQFNEFLHIFCECLLPSLCLKDIELEFLNLMTELDFLELSELFKLDEAEHYIKRLREPFSSEYFKYKLLFSYHLDIIIIVNKIRSFCNSLILPNNITDILDI